MVTITKFQSNPFFHSIDSSSSSHPPVSLSQEELKKFVNKMLLQKSLFNFIPPQSQIHIFCHFPPIQVFFCCSTICSTKASDSVGFHVRSAKKHCCIAKPRKTLSMKYILWNLLRKLCRKFLVDCQTRTRMAEN